MKVATLLFYALVTFLLGAIATWQLAPAVVYSYADEAFQRTWWLVNAATFGGAGLFLVLAGLELLWEMFGARSAQDVARAARREHDHDDENARAHDERDHRP